MTLCGQRPASNSLSHGTALMCAGVCVRVCVGGEQRAEVGLAKRNRFLDASHSPQVTLFLGSSSAGYTLLLFLQADS
jgi:hypothetical protein